MPDTHVFRDKLHPDNWRVEHDGKEGDGVRAITIFIGSDAQRRAQQYAEWLETRATPSSSADAKP